MFYESVNSLDRNEFYFKSDVFMHKGFLNDA